MRAAWSVVGRPLLIAILVLELLVLAVGVWFGLSARLAVAELTSARDDLLAAREAVSASQRDQGVAFMESAAAHAEAASTRVNGPLWDIVAAIPALGHTAGAGQALATSVDQTLTALQPVVEQLNVLDPNNLVSGDGQIDVSAVEKAVPALQQAQPGIDEAVRTMQSAPSDGWVPRQLRDATGEFSEQLTTLQSSLSTAVTFGEIAGQLLGADEEKGYFVGILNPNEARGTGGFMGSYAILSAQDGKVRVAQVGSNTDLPNLEKLPASLDRQFRKRYGADPLQRGSMNLSPHFPDTAKIWLASWQAKTGQRLDGAIAVDVEALSSLVEASKQQIPLPDNGSMSGAELADFALKGIYERFPATAQDRQRKLYQVQVMGSAVRTVTEAPRPQAMAAAMGAALGERRMAVWSEDSDVEDRLLAADVGGSLRVPGGHRVQAVVINTSGSKLDAYLDRSLAYDVGRCEYAPGRVQSRVTFELTNDIPFGERPPEDMVGLAASLPTGPVNSSQVQVHLPNGAEVLEVEVDGKPDGYTPFLEQDRPAVLARVTLPPREKRTLTVQFSEPASDTPADVRVQPLANDQRTAVIDAPCWSTTIESPQP